MRRRSPASGQPACDCAALMLNVGGSIGESTRREWDYPLRLGKRVRYQEPADA